MNTAERGTESAEDLVPQTPVLHFVAGETVRGGRGAGSAAGRLEDVWDQHGSSVYALACTLLGDEARAERAVTLAMIDLALTRDGVTVRDARRPLAEHVYRRSQALLGDVGGSDDLPPAMAWVARLAPLQRASLGLCCFGGHTHREAAALLGVSPGTVADLLTAGLREIAAAAA